MWRQAPATIRMNCRGEEGQRKPRYACMSSSIRATSALSQSIERRRCRISIHAANATNADASATAANPAIMLIFATYYTCGRKCGLICFCSRNRNGQLRSVDFMGGEIPHLVGQKCDRCAARRTSRPKHRLEPTVFLRPGFDCVL